MDGEVTAQPPPPLSPEWQLEVTTGMDALVWWIGFAPPVRTYPGGKVMDALAVLAYVPAWHAAPTRVAAPDLFCSVSLSVATEAPFFSRVSWSLIVVTLLLQSTMAVASTEPATVLRRACLR